MPPVFMYIKTSFNNRVELVTRQITGSLQQIETPVYNNI